MNYKEVLEDSGIPFLSLDEGGYILEANIAACELFNYSHEKIRGLLSDKIITCEVDTPPSNGKKYLKTGFGIQKSGDKFPIEYKIYSFGEENTEEHSKIIAILNQQKNHSQNNNPKQEIKMAKPPNQLESVPNNFSS